jgi:hypothetical protein
MDEALIKQAQDRVDYEAAHDPTVKQIIRIVEDFLKSTQVMCYGGTAINNLLPPKDRFYDPEYDIPDYDFYSKEPQLHALRLADKYSKAGFKSVEVKPGVHLMTYKVFVSFIGVADITFLEPKIFDKLWKEDIHHEGIHYVSPNFLRISMYLELSRPRGDIERWKKVYERLMLLNKHYIVGCKNGEETLPPNALTAPERKKIEHILHGKDLVLLGSHAIELHSKSRKNLWNVPIDVLSVDVDSKVQAFVDVFGSDRVKVLKHPPYAELLPAHVDILEIETGFLLVRIFQTVGCHSYHELHNGLKVASIPTLLQFFMGFVYADAHFLEGYDENRIICISQRLVDLAHSKKASRRFELLTPIDCIGRQATLRDVKAHTAEIKEKTSKKSSDFLKFFFMYKPGTLTGTQKQKLRKSLKETMRRTRADDRLDLVADKTE